MSVVFDCFWWWRHEFGHAPHESQSSSNSNEPLNNESHRTADASHTDQQFIGLSGPDGPAYEAGILDLSEYPDWNWPDSPGYFDRMFESC